ncbi:hypothetical protein TWF696_005393 [Orbilia brochopaga]
MVRHEARGVPNLLTASQAPADRKVAASAIVIAAPAPAAPALTERPIPTNVDALLYDDDNVAAYNEEQTATVSTSEQSPRQPGRLSYDDDQQFGYENYGNDEVANDGDYGDEEYDDDEWPMDPYDSDSDNSSAYYDDGAYIARSAPTLPTPSITTPGALPPRTISQTWHDALLTNFHATRDAILTTPIDPSETTTFPENPTLWRDYMMANNPSLPVLQSITSEIAIKALKHIRKNVGWVNVHEWQGQWIWALLARTNDVGVLMNEEVSILRELGKKAVFNLGKAADSRAKIVASGGQDWWNEEMQRKVMEYMNGGGESTQDTEDPDDSVQVDERVEIPAEDTVEESGEEAAAERPAKKVALFRPRVVAVKDKAAARLAVPTISVTPATPKPEELEEASVQPLEIDAEASVQLPAEVETEAGDQVDQNVVITPAIDADKEEETPAIETDIIKETPTIGIDGIQDTPMIEVDVVEETPTIEIDAVEETPTIKIDVGESTLPVVGEASGQSAATDNQGMEEGEVQETATLRIPDVKTMFALDMIVSIVGEAFGQRDLLAERR